MRLAVSTRIMLANSLVMSRLIYNIHVWSGVDSVSRRIVNSVYNRVWRRVLGKPRFGRTDVCDADVRAALRVPSIDCLIRKRRLLYVSRIAKAGIPSLHALLQLRDVSGRFLPWLQLIISDCATLQQRLPRILGELPSPSVDFEPWWELCSRFQCEWKQIVAQYHTHFDDVEFVRKAGPSSITVAATIFCCDLCTNGVFESQKALDQHKRVKHKIRTPVADFVGHVSKCPICLTDFGNRARLITHLSERRIQSKVRQTNCHFEFMNNLPSKLDQISLRPFIYMMLRLAELRVSVDIRMSLPSVQLRDMC